jgi:hypothetical protein
MPARVLRLVCFLACLAITLPVVAQEGHPLKGSWLGDWGATRDRRNTVVVVLDWDGKNITGAINPGPDAVPLTKASLEPKGWVVHFEADGKDRTGKTVHYVIDGKIENLGLYNRSIIGTWTEGATKGDFKITRQ